MLNELTWYFRSNLGLIMSFVIFFVKFSGAILFTIMPSVIVSLKPPLLLIITPQPLLAASKLVLPNGSFHLEQTTAIEAFSRFFKTFMWSWNPKFFNLVCVKFIFSLGSSPITIADQSLYLFSIGNTALPYLL